MPALPGWKSWKKLLMRSALLSVALVVLVPAAFAESPKPLIKGAVLEGTWTSAKGDKLTFKGANATYRTAAGKAVSGAYRLEGYKLLMKTKTGDVAIGWIGLEKPTEFRLNFTKTEHTRFTKR